jgi:hypothetical protein
MCGQILQPLKFGIMHKQNSRQQLATCVKKLTYSQAYAPRPNQNCKSKIINYLYTQNGREIDTLYTKKELHISAQRLRPI